MIKNTCVLYDRGDKIVCENCKREYNKKISLDTVINCKHIKKSTNVANSLTIEQQIGEGPGTELKKLIPGFLEHKGCGCKEFAKNMNVWGIEGCKKNKQAIVDRLVSESKKRFGLNLVPKMLTAIVAEQMVDNAIKNYEEKIKNDKT